MGKRQKHLTEEEVWDDSALLSSWNDALAEYQLYHSIHARGERVEDVLKEFEAKDDTQNGQAVAGEGNPGDAENAKPANGVVSDELEDGELEDESEPNLQAANDVLSSPTHLHRDDSNNSEQPSSGPSIPHVLISNVTDEALKNLMIAWYYAGYYTRLYEDQQKSGATANKSSGQSGNTHNEEAAPLNGSS